MKKLFLKRSVWTFVSKLCFVLISASHVFRGGISLWSLWLSSITIFWKSLLVMLSLLVLRSWRPVSDNASEYGVQEWIILNPLRPLLWIISRSFDKYWGKLSCYTSILLLINAVPKERSNSFGKESNVDYRDALKLLNIKPMESPHENLCDNLFRSVETNHKIFHLPPEIHNRVTFYETKTILIFLLLALKTHLSLPWAISLISYVEYTSNYYVTIT